MLVSLLLGWSTRHCGDFAVELFHTLLMVVLTLGIFIRHHIGGICTRGVPGKYDGRGRTTRGTTGGKYDRQGRTTGGTHTTTTHMVNTVYMGTYRRWDYQPGP